MACTAIAYCALSIFPEAHYTDGNPLTLAVKNLLYSFRGFSMTRGGILVPCLYLFFRFLGTRVPAGERRRPSSMIPAALFSLFLVFGYSYQAQGNWDLAVGARYGEWLQGAVQFAGYFVFFRFAVSALFCLLDRPLPARLPPEPDTGLRGRYLSALRRAPFRTALITLLLAYLPMMLLARPGLFSGDTASQAVQAFPVLQKTGVSYLTPENVLNRAVMINQHHPAAHTLLLQGFLRLGIRLTGSLDTGFFLYTASQALFFLCSIACAVSVLLRRQVLSPRASVLLLLYAALHPLLRNYAFLVTKDVPYASFLLLLAAQLFSLSVGDGKRGRLIAAMVCAAGVILFRNEGRYVLLLSFALIFLLSPGQRKTAGALFGFSLLFSLLVFHLVYPALSFTPGSRKEMLSIPFQQTARTVREYGDDITEEERLAIGAVLDYDRLAKSYNPNLSDGVKTLYKNESTSGDLLRYLKTLVSLGARHPDSFVQAFANNYYEYVYPGERRFMRYSFSWSWQNAIRIQYRLRKLDAVFPVPRQLPRLQQAHDLLMEWIPSLPGFSLLLTPGCYGWALLLLIFYAARRKTRSAAWILAVPTTVWLVCFAGPANAYYGRYLFPIVVMLPFLIPMVLSLCRGGLETAEKENP